MIFSTMHESESPAVDQVPVKNKYCLNRRYIQKYIQKKNKKSTFSGPLFVTSKKSRTKSRNVSDKLHESRKLASLISLKNIRRITLRAYMYRFAAKINAKLIPWDRTDAGSWRNHVSRTIVSDELARDTDGVTRRENAREIS